MQIEITDKQWNEIARALKIMCDTSSAGKQIAVKATALRSRAEEMRRILHELERKGDLRVARTTETRTDYKRL